MHKYRLISKKGEGTFSEVLKAQSIKTGKYVAIKCMKNHFDSLEQVNNLREIQALRRLSPHPNIVKLLEVLYDEPTGRLALVFELMEMNLYEGIKGRRHYLQESKVKYWMYNLLKSLDHMHRNGIYHRDIKPENVLLLDEKIKLADFGSCRGIYSKQPYTEYISTRWYRAPECLLTDGYYNYKMDIWGVGCVFFEVLSLFPLFAGTNELDQVNKIHNILGTPPAEILNRFKKHASHMDFNFPQKEGTGIDSLISHISSDAKDIILLLLIYDPDQRISARQALKHCYFKELRDQDKRMHRAIAVQPYKMLQNQNDDEGGQYSNQQDNPPSKKQINIKNKQQQKEMHSKLPEIKQEAAKIASSNKNYEEESKVNLPSVKLNPQQKNYNMYVSGTMYKQPQQSKYQKYMKPHVQGISAYKNATYNYKKDAYKKHHVSPYSSLNNNKFMCKPYQYQGY